MTSIPQLVARLESRSIILSLADGQLRYRSPRDALTEADRAAIRAQRDALIDFLAAREADGNGALRRVQLLLGDALFTDFIDFVEQHRQQLLDARVISGGVNAEGSGIRRAAEI